MPIQEITKDELRDAVAGLQGWTVENGKLHRAFQFADFGEAFGFIAQVALAAERADHHPELFNCFNKVVIDLTTHEANGITHRDISLAEKIDKMRP